MRYFVPLTVMLVMAYAASDYLDLPMLNSIKKTVNNAVGSELLGGSKKAGGGGILGEAKQVMADNLASVIVSASTMNKSACMVGSKQCLHLSDCSSAAQVGQKGLIEALPEGYVSLRGDGSWPSACTFTVTDAYGNAITSKPVGITPAP